MIAALRIKGLHPIIAADYSPARRKLAEKMGADIVVDPARRSRTRAGPSTPRCRPERRRRGPPRRRPRRAEAGADLRMRRRARRDPADVRERAARRPHRRGRCVHGERQIEPMFGILKELSLQFVLAYTPEEFAASLRLLAEGQVDAASTRHRPRRPFDGVARAFDDLANPEAAHQDHRRALAVIIPRGEEARQRRLEPRGPRLGPHLLDAATRLLRMRRRSYAVPMPLDNSETPARPRPSALCC